MSAVGVGVGAVVAAQPAAAWSVPVGLAAAAGFLAAGFGNVLNDLTDVEIDKLAHPGRPLPSGALPQTQARVVAAVAAAGALALGALVSLAAAAFVAGALGLMALYEFALKERGFAGNLGVAVLTGAPFLFGGLAAAGPGAMLGPVLVLAALAALANVGREVLKDVEDMTADVGRRTVPREYGRPVARQVAAAGLLAAVVLSPLPWMRGDVAWTYLPVVAAADALFLAAAFHAKAARAQHLAKAGMLVALAAFLAGRLAA